MINLNTIKRYLSTNDISFLIDFDKTIDIDKSGKAYYARMFRIELELITKFIDELNVNEIYLVNPMISISCRYNEPYLTFSRQFLISNQSNPILITNFLINQFCIAKEDFDFQTNNYFIIFKYKIVKLDKRIF